MNRPTIAEVEAMIQRDDIDIEIKPDGTVIAVHKERTAPMPVTFRQDLPSNY